MRRMLAALMVMTFAASCTSSQRHEGSTAMMLVPMKSVAPVTEQWIRDLEQRVGGRLPDDYVVFLRHSNGGWIQGGWRPNSLEGPVLQGFFPVMTGGSSVGVSDSLHVHDMLSDGRLPPWFVPVAETGRAAVYCISVGKNDYGKMYEVYEDDDQDEIPFEKREYAVAANSFTDFYQQVVGNYTDPSASPTASSP